MYLAALNRVHQISSAANGLIAAVLAPACAVCKALLDSPIEGCVCRTCWASIRAITPPVCDACGDPLPRATERCRQCAAEVRAVSQARAIGEYDGTLREIVHALKYNGRRSLAKPLAAMMRTRGTDVLTDADCVVPVPLHWRREYARGFNQARELARHVGLPVLDALVRGRHTRAQVELAADRRRVNVAGAFRVHRRWWCPSDVRGMRVVLVDDVSTTGATLEACAGVLKEAGAAHVCALTAARVVARKLPRAGLL